MNISILKKNYAVILAFAAIYIIWGTTYLAIRIGLESIPPFIMASMRYLIAGILLFLFCAAKKEVLLAKSALNNILLGAIILTGGQGVIFWAEKYISSGLTAVLISTLPIWYILIDKRHWKSYFNSKLTLLSILLGIAGILILFKNPSDTDDSHTGWITVLASMVVIASCICWAAGSLYYKYNLTAGSLYVNVACQLVGGTISCLLISKLTNEWHQFSIPAITLNSWLAVLYLAIAGSIIAFLALFWLLSIKPAPVVGTHAYVNPIIAVLLGSLAGETINAGQVIGMIVILLAAYLANKVKFSSIEPKPA